ncbi:hypothetical protein [Halobacillus litoralis]|uniref:hypothetical protein n=1 Tax=Halobacillus litoralis TaxID=45668 RepID=UPI001CD3E633|nr:hypothetical protein [Halobacillus litoralis]MCA1021998.1 hypothetical protein [Halobacillus litoralis]
MIYKRTSLFFLLQSKEYMKTWIWGCLIFGLEGMRLQGAMAIFTANVKRIVKLMKE